MSVLSQRIREARMAMNPHVTQRDVAKRCGLSPSAVNLWESGKTEPSATNLVILAKWFRVSTDWLLGMYETPGESK
jgi:transcriptional regulator with XRE-family HTH domain